MFSFAGQAYDLRIPPDAPPYATACVANDAARMAVLLREGVSPNREATVPAVEMDEEFEETFSLLFLSVLAGAVDVAAVLLDGGADPEDVADLTRRAYEAHPGGSPEDNTDLRVLRTVVGRSARWPVAVAPHHFVASDSEIPTPLYVNASVVLQRLHNESEWSFLLQSETAVGPDGMPEVADAIAVNSNVITLNITYNQLNDAGTVVLADALLHNHSIRSLDLSGNRIGPAGAAALAEVLRSNNGIRALNIQNNRVGDPGVVALAEGIKNNGHLAILNLSCNKIGLAGAAALAEALRHNTGLQNLDIHNNRIKAPGAVVLAAALKVNKFLLTLNVGFNAIGSSGGAALAEALQTNSALTTLDMHRNEIGDVQPNECDGVHVLAFTLLSNHCLTTLILAGNRIDAHGFERLAVGLRTNATLTFLDTTGNRPGQPGLRAMEEMTRANTALTHMPGLAGSSPQLRSLTLANRQRAKAQRAGAIVASAPPGAAPATPAAAAAAAMSAALAEEWASPPHTSASANPGATATTPTAVAVAMVAEWEARRNSGVATPTSGATAAAPRGTSSASSGAANQPGESPEVSGRKRPRPEPEPEDPLCAICLESRLINEPRILPPCGHTLHAACIARLPLPLVCPVCRKPTTGPPIRQY